MSKKYLSAVIFVIIAIVIIVIIALASNSGTATPQVPTSSVGSETTNPNTAGTTTTPVAGSTYTLADVTKHATQADCWTTINGAVYNVTSWIAKHPGGAQAIIGLCGIDGSDAFNGQHGGQRRPASELASFKIGTLAQ